MHNYEEIKNNVLHLIKENQFIELKIYLKRKNILIKEFNTVEFDILTYSLENVASGEIIEYLIQQCPYKQLNYTFHALSTERNAFSFPQAIERIHYSDYKIPLFIALSKNSFEVADILLKYNADINYHLDVSTEKKQKKLNILEYLYCSIEIIDFLNIKNMKYILNKGFNIREISTDLINNLVANEYRNEIVRELFNFCIFDQSFILKFLSLAKYQRPLTDVQFSDVLATEKNKIKITEKTYSEAIANGNYEILKTLLEYDGSEEKTILYRINHYGLLEKAITTNDVELVKKIMDCNFFELCTAGEFESILIKVIEQNNTIDILKLFNGKLKEYVHHHQSSTDFNYESVLLKASKKRNINMMTYFLDILLQYPDEFHNDHSLSPYNFSLISQYDHAFYLLILNMAVKLRHLELVKYLLNHSNTLLPPSEPHLNINLKDRNNECPVLISVGDLTLYTTDHYTTSIKIFKFLLDHGADSNLKGVHGEPLLSVVLSFKIYVAAQYLLKCPIKIEEGDIFESYQPLMKAIYANEFDQVQSILCHPTTIVNVYPSNNTVLNYHGYGFTSVILAYMLNHKEIFNVLLASSNINELDLYGYSLLHYAILREDRKMVKELLRRGARVNYQENKYGRGNSALDIAITIKNLDIFETLIQSDQLKVNKGNGQGEIPLMTAIKLENDRQEDKLKMIKRLIELGSDVNFCTGNGMTPLRYAIHCRSLPILQLLVENGAHFNIMVNNKFGSKKFILMEALETDDAAIIQYIMQYHEERSVSLIKDIRVIDLIELMDQKGHLELFEWLSPFPVISKVIQAIPYYNKLELLRRLVQDRKIDIDIRDENGDTLLANAIRVCNFKMAYYLIEQGADIYNVNNRGESIYDLSYQYSCQPKHDSYKIDNSRKIYRIIKKIMEQSE